MPTTLVSHAKYTWKASVVFIAALVVAALLFDGYVFLFYVQNVEQSIDVGEDGTVPEMKKSALAEAKDILARRKKLYENIGANLPPHNPFLEKATEKK